MLAVLFDGVNGRLKNFGLDLEIAEIVTEVAMETLNDGIIEAVSANAEFGGEIGLSEGTEFGV